MVHQSIQQHHNGKTEIPVTTQPFQPLQVPIKFDQDLYKDNHLSNKTPIPVELDDLSSAPLVALKVDEPLLFRDVSGEGFLGYLSAIISTEVVESWLYKFGF